MTVTTEPRVAAIVPMVVDAIAAVVRDARVTYDEYRAAIAFIEESVRTGELPLLADVFLAVAVDDAEHAHDEGTESNVEGPFYVPGAPMLEAPFELPRRADERGDVLLWSGAVRDTEGRALAGAELDIWQADADGLYSNVYPAVPEWNLRGRLRTGADGRFSVRTVVPAAYEIPKDGPTGRLLAALGRHCFRPAHLHVKVSHPACRPLTTQLYFADDPWLGSDVVGAVKDSLVVSLAATGDGALSCAYDFVLDRV